MDQDLDALANTGRQIIAQMDFFESLRKARLMRAARQINPDEERREAVELRECFMHPDKGFRAPCH